MFFLLQKHVCCRKKFLKECFHKMKWRQILYYFMCDVTINKTLKTASYPIQASIKENWQVSKLLFSIVSLRCCHQPSGSKIDSTLKMDYFTICIVSFTLVFKKRRAWFNSSMNAKLKVFKLKTIYFQSFKNCNKSLSNI